VAAPWQPSPTLAGVDRGPDVAALLADIAGIGPFFAVATGPAPAGGGWVPVRALSADPAVDDPLRARIGAVRSALGTDERVAASTAFQGLAAQLVAPLFAAAVVHRALPVPSSPPAAAPTPAAAPDAPWRPVAVSDGCGTTTRDHEALGVAAGVAVEAAAGLTAGELAEGIAAALHWRPGGTGPWLWWAGTGGSVGPCPDALLGDVLAALLAPLVAAVRARASVAERVLWGNAASAVGAARRLVAAARPPAAVRAAAAAAHLLTTPPLAATAALRRPEPPDVGWTLRRRSCCLYYRVPGGGVCGDCVLRDVLRDRPRR
jgi:hypothetical protein